MEPKGRCLDSQDLGQRYFMNCPTLISAGFVRRIPTLITQNSSSNFMPWRQPSSLLVCGTQMCPGKSAGQLLVPV